MVSKFATNNHKAIFIELCKTTGLKKNSRIDPYTLFCHELTGDDIKEWKSRKASTEASTFLIQKLFSDLV